MGESTGRAVEGRPIWIDLATADPEAAKAFYSKLFGWDYWTNPDPLYGGYVLASLRGGATAGISGLMSPDAPTAWTAYFGTENADALAKRIVGSGGAVIVAPMVVGDQGTMLIFADATGAFVGAWQADKMAGFGATGPGTFRWAELSARGIERAQPFYSSVFGWIDEVVPMGEEQPPYHRWSIGSEPVAGGMEMNPSVPAMVPSYWTIYFDVEDVRSSFATAIAAGATEMVAPMEYPGGRFAILSDPQGAVFALMSEAS
jgi:uncharacterized protein